MSYIVIAVIGKANNSYYLSNEAFYWTGSPAYYWYGTAYSYIHASSNMFQQYPVNVKIGVRYVISIKQGIPVLSGIGTTTDPYLIG